MTTPAKKPAARKPAATTTARATAAKPAAKAPVRRPAASAAPAAAAVAPNYTKPYKMLTGIDDSEFCDKVVRHLENGYELYGSPTSTFNGKNVIVGQAVVLKKKAKKASKAKGKKK
jgi:hypothetical protein